MKPDAIDGYLAALLRRTGIDGLVAHLQTHHGARILGLEELDLGVFRIDLRDGSRWVARVFPALRPLAEVQVDARILQALEQGGFPAERCLGDVTEYEGQGVLVTGFVEGRRSKGSDRAFAALGGMLGRLHTRPAGRLRPGGAWHHLAVSGGPEEEIAQARRAVGAMGPQVRPEDREAYRRLEDALNGIDDCRGLPEGILHPDFVPANAIVPPEGGLVMVDWTGTGRGPRLWSLSFLLWAAGDSAAADAVVERYRAHVRLEPEELERMAGAMRARPLTMAAWSWCTGRRSLVEVAAGIPATVERAEAVAARVRRAFDQ